MLITTKHRSSLVFGCVTFTIKSYAPLQMKQIAKFLFLFSELSLHQPNIMKLIHNAYYHKTQYEFG